MRAHECLQKLQGSKGSEVDEDVHARSGASTSSSVPSVEILESTSALPKKDSQPTNPLRIQKSYRRVLKFTADEDDFLKKGIDRHGFGQWTAILRDPDSKLKREERRTR